MCKIIRLTVARVLFFSSSLSARKEYCMGFCVAVQLIVLVHELGNGIAYGYEI